jgi:hypothetical protein
MEPGLKAGGGAWSLFAANHLAPSFLLTPDLSERAQSLKTQRNLHSIATQLIDKKKLRSYLEKARTTSELITQAQPGPS